MTEAEQLEARYPFRSLRRWQHAANYYSNAAQFLDAASLEKGVHTVLERGVPIDLYADLEPGRPLAIFLNAAQPRGPEVKLPVFAGFGVLPTSTGVSRLCINDPSLYLSPKLTLGWYAGSQKLKLQLILPKLIANVIRLANPSSVMFAGGSGGGFASLYYSRLFPGSLAVVWNPQTSILEYDPRAVARYASVAFGLSTIEEAIQRLPSLVDTDVRALYASSPGNFVLYMQNQSDSHVEGHMRPFLAAVGSADAAPGLVRSDLYLRMGNWSEGHAAPPKEFMSELFGSLVNYPSGWGHLFAGENLTGILNCCDAQISTR